MNETIKNIVGIIGIYLVIILCALFISMRFNYLNKASISIEYNDISQTKK